MLRCAAASLRSAACLRVSNNTELVSKRLARGIVDVRNCTLLVGHNQIGVLVTNCARAHFDNNIIRCIDGRSAAMRLGRELAENPELLAELRRTLYSDIQTGRSSSRSRLNLTLANTIINMRVDVRLAEIKFFSQLREFFSPEKVRDLITARQYLRESVHAVLLKPDLIPGFAGYFEMLLKEDLPALYQGITIGGVQADEVSITNTTISDALQGIHIGQSASRSEQILKSGTVQIRGNLVTSRITPTVNRGGYGVLIGNCDSLLIEDNRVEREQIEATQHMAMYGLYASGYYGRRLIMRHNQTEHYTLGLVVDPKNKAPKKDGEGQTQPGIDPLWLVADNLGSVRATSQLVRVEGNVE